MTSGYSSVRDRKLVEAYLRDLGLRPVRMADIGYDMPEGRQCYLFVALGKTPAGRDEYSVQMVFVYDDSTVYSVPIDFLNDESEAVRSFQEEVVSQRNLLMVVNGEHRQRKGTGVPEGYGDVLKEILSSFQVGDYRVVEVDGRPAVEFSVYQCDPEYALEDYAAVYDGDRMVYTVFLDDPHGKRARMKKSQGGSKAGGGQRKSTGKAQPSGKKGKAGAAPGKKRSDRSASAVQSGRSRRSQTMDSKRHAKVTFPADYTDEQYAKWASNPGRYDIEGIDTPTGSRSLRSRSAKPGIYGMDDWSHDRQFAARPGQEVTSELYDQMQFQGPPMRIRTSTLDRYGCVRGFVCGWVSQDPDQRMAFGETPDGRFLYLGLVKMAKPLTSGTPTWYDEYRHEPKKNGKTKSSGVKSENGNAERRSMWSESRHLASTPGDEGLSGRNMNVATTRGNGGRQPKGDGKKGNMASNARKSKSNTQPRNKKGRFISREMAERPRKANGQFKRVSGKRS